MFLWHKPSSTQFLPLKCGLLNDLLSLLLYLYHLPLYHLHVPAVASNPKKQISFVPFIGNFDKTVTQLGHGSVTSVNNNPLPSIFVLVSDLTVNSFFAVVLPSFAPVTLRLYLLLLLMRLLLLLSFLKHIELFARRLPSFLNTLVEQTSDVHKLYFNLFIVLLCFLLLLLLLHFFLPLLRHCQLHDCICLYLPF